MNLCNFERFFKFERRQNRRQTFCQHCFARSGRTDQQNIMRARRWRFRERVLPMLPANFRKINPIFFSLFLNSEISSFNGGTRRVFAASKVRTDFDGFAQISDGKNIYFLTTAASGRIFFGNKKIFYAVFTRPQRDRKRAAHRTNAPVER